MSFLKKVSHVLLFNYREEAVKGHYYLFFLKMCHFHECSLADDPLHFKIVIMINLTEGFAEPLRNNAAFRAAAGAPDARGSRPL